MCGSYQDLTEYFKKVTRPPYDVNSLNDCYEIPTLPIDDQLKKIENSKLPKIGFVFYFKRVIDTTPPDFKVIPVVEAVYISDAFIQRKYEEVLQYFQNTDIMEGKSPKV